jgi:hypothetical protein
MDIQKYEKLQKKEYAEGNIKYLIMVNHFGFVKLIFMKIN